MILYFIAPSPPINLGFDYLTHNSVLLQWTQPTHPNGNLRGYIVCYDEKVYKDMIDLTRSLCLDAGNMQSYQVEELKPGKCKTESSVFHLRQF